MDDISQGILDDPDWSTYLGGEREIIQQENPDLLEGDADSDDTRNGNTADSDGEVYNSSYISLFNSLVYQEYLGARGEFELENDLCDFIYSSLSKPECQYNRNELNILFENLQKRNRYFNRGLKKTVSQDLVDHFNSNNLMDNILNIQYSSSTSAFAPQTNPIIDQRPLYYPSLFSDAERNRNKTPEDNFMDYQGMIWENKLHRQKMQKQRRLLFKSYSHSPYSTVQASESADLWLHPDYEYGLNRKNPIPSGAKDSKYLFLNYPKPHIKSFCHFHEFFIEPKPSLVHFQLRNLVTSVDSSTIYYSENKNSNSRIMKLDPLTGKTYTIVDNEELDNINFKISTISATSNLLTAGSFNGSILLYSPETKFKQVFSLTDSFYGGTNYICISRNPRFKDELAIASNDSYLRYFDIKQNKITKKTLLPFSLNCIADDPNNGSNELLFVGDSSTALIFDRRMDINESFSNAIKISDHFDYSFACDWNTNNLLATGNQDGTINLYDRRMLVSNDYLIENTSKSNHLLKITGMLNGAVRNIKFDATGKYLAFAESIDNVYVIDLQNPWTDNTSTTNRFIDVPGLNSYIYERRLEEDKKGKFNKDYSINKKPKTSTTDSLFSSDLTTAASCSMSSSDEDMYDDALESPMDDYGHNFSKTKSFHHIEDRDRVAELRGSKRPNMISETQHYSYDDYLHLKEKCRINRERKNIPLCVPEKDFVNGSFGLENEPYINYQHIDVFGKITGLSFIETDNGSGQILTIGIADGIVGGVMQYEFNSKANADELFLDYII